MKTLRAIFICILSITLPISQTYAVAPDSDSVFHEVIESIDEPIDGSESGSDPLETLESGAVSPDLFDSDLMISSDILSEADSSSEDLTTQVQDDLLSSDHQGFWTQRKVVVTTSILLTTGLLLLLLIAGGRGGNSDGFFSGFGSIFG